MKFQPFFRQAETQQQCVRAGEWGLGGDGGGGFFADRFVGLRIPRPGVSFFFFSSLPAPSFLFLLCCFNLSDKATSGSHTPFRLSP